MKLSDISNIRLTNQQIAAPKSSTVNEIVSWMGAIQSQDFPMSKWALGIRLINSTDKMIEAAFDKGEVLRTHILRPTLHMVSAENIRWLLKLTAPGIKTRLKTRQKELNLNETILKKCNSIFRDSLKGGNHLTREELAVILDKAKVHLENHRIYHVLVNSELDGITCSGKLKGGKQTFALLDERVPEIKELTKEASLGKIAGIYFSSRGPATIQDFTWWSGLSVSDSRNALELAKPDLDSEVSNSEIYWFSKHCPFSGIENISTYLLPAFDEFLISYKNRTHSLPFNYRVKTVSDNGIFRPIIVVNGQVRGLWNRTIKKDKVIIEAKLFEPVSTQIKYQIKKQGEAFGLFLNKKTEVNLIITGYDKRIPLGKMDKEL